MRIRFLSKGPIDQISGGYLYNKYLLEHCRDSGIDVIYHPSVENLTPDEENDVLIVDSLALPDSLTQLLSLRTRLVLLLHVMPDPSRLGPSGEQLLASLLHRSRVVVTGDATLAVLHDRLAVTAVDAIKIEPGVPGYWRTKERYSDGARQLLGVANYLPGKGIARLIEVLAELRDLPWELTVRGNVELDPDHHRSMRRLVERLGLAERIALLGPVPHDIVNEEMIRADLLVHFSERESYSMVTAEAIACGLPVLSYRTGSADSFARSGLVRHVASCAERDTLRLLIEEADAYASLRRAEPRTVRTWQDVGDEFVDWLKA